jgi:hypothetical protein
LAQQLLAHRPWASEGCEFHHDIDGYRGMVEDAVFDHLGRLSFFFEAVEVVMGESKRRSKQQQRHAPLGRHRKAESKATARA